MLLTLSLVLLLVHFVTKNGGGNSVPNAWQSLVELIHDFVPNPVNEQIGGLSGNVQQKFSPRISVTSTFSLFRNPQGMIPYSFTVTSHFLITLGLSFPIFIGITIVGFQRNGLHFLSFSLPAGVPLPLAPFLVLLELIPHCFRALSSGIRLFANMMAGHSSVKILSGSAWTMLCMNDLFYFIGDPGPLFIVLALTGPELGVAISQAHVSTISICIYLNDATNLHQSGYLFIIEQKRGAFCLSFPPDRIKEKIKKRFRARLVKVYLVFTTSHFPWLTINVVLTISAGSSIVFLPHRGNDGGILYVSAYWNSF